MDVVITTINNITEGVAKFSRIDAVSKVILVGDKKTPAIDGDHGIEFIDIGRQLKAYPQFASALPFNHYCRKMIGYLVAANYGGELLYDTDDDNIPLDNWSIPSLASVEVPLVQSEDRWVNVYELFTNQRVWPRGLPLNSVMKRNNFRVEHSEDVEKVGVFQGLADCDPDVDSIYRLVVGQDVVFAKEKSFAIDQEVYVPFNSQNTYWRKSFLRLMYLPVTVSFRYTDILRSYVAQRILWEAESRVAFISPTVYQVRNQHDLMADFSDEVPMFKSCEEVASMLSSLSLSGDLERSLEAAYAGLVKIGVCDPRELDVLHAWLRACNAVQD